MNQEQHRLGRASELTFSECTLTVTVPGGIRTPNLLIRSQLLYPVELQTHSHSRGTRPSSESSAAHATAIRNSLVPSLWDIRLDVIPPRLYASPRDRGRLAEAPSFH